MPERYLKYAPKPSKESDTKKKKTSRPSSRKQDRKHKKPENVYDLEEDPIIGPAYFPSGLRMLFATCLPPNSITDEVNMFCK